MSVINNDAMNAAAAKSDKTEKAVVMPVRSLM